MQLWGLSLAEVRRITAEVSADKYGGNVRLNDDARDESGPRGTRCRFTLRCDSSRGPGARRSASGRRTVNASWDAHYDVMAALFEAGADRIKSAMADYRAGRAMIRGDGYSWDDRGPRNAGTFASGREAFYAIAERTAGLNVGSLIAPVEFGNL